MNERKGRKSKNGQLENRKVDTSHLDNQERNRAEEAA